MAFLAVDRSLNALVSRPLRSAREVDKQQLEDAMKTRWPVRLKTLTDFINAGKHDKQDFVVFGVLSEKGADRMNKKVCGCRCPRFRVRDDSDVHFGVDMS